MRNRAGASIAQYAIVLGILCGVVAISFLFLGTNIKNQFTRLNNMYEGNNTVIADNIRQMSIIRGDLSGGDLGGSFDNPELECAGDTCALDLGPFVLNSIPEDFGEFVETSGTSGGTDQLANMFDQIADYLKESENEEGYEDYKNLANLGHFIADIHETIEDTARSCQQYDVGSDDGLHCFDRSMRDRASALVLPDELATILPDYRDYELYRLIKDGMYIGEAKNEIGDNYNTRDVDVYPSYAMVALYDQIMANPNYAPELKNITEELYLNMSDLGFQQSSLAQCVKEGVGDGKAFYEFDALTGDRLERVDFIIEEGLNDLLKPNASAFTDLDSALICTASGNNSNSNKCHDKVKAKDQEGEEEE